MIRTQLHMFLTLLLTLTFLMGCGKADADALEAGDPNPAPSAAVEDMNHEPVAETAPVRIGESLDTSVTDPVPPEDPVAASAYVVIQNAGPRDPKLLVYELQQVLRKTQVVKQVQSPNNREIKLEVTNIKDVRALANKIPFASVESIDIAKRTIIVDFDL